ncbi:MAG: hypothetical protein GF416_05005 [Candidatus Altiarchaeales archaeon]|nr:hypothetical protein [Candidatus Altiarchaeales archaeon]MBD3416476.1 hypothetical protein [Candidatus Altiarchaeales archaeon]
MEIFRRFRLYAREEGLHQVGLCPDAGEFADRIACRWHRGERPKLGMINVACFGLFKLENVDVQLLKGGKADGERKPAILAHDRSKGRKFLIMREDDDAPRFGLYAREKDERFAPGEKRYPMVQVEKEGEVIDYLPKSGEIVPIAELKKLR